jgi:hypothetical protein
MLVATIKFSREIFAWLLVRDFESLLFREVRHLPGRESRFFVAVLLRMTINLSGDLSLRSSE